MLQTFLLIFFAAVSALQIHGEIYVPEKANEYPVDWLKPIANELDNTTIIFQLNKNSSLHYLYGYSIFSPNDDQVFSMGLTTGSSTSSTKFNLKLENNNKKETLQVEIKVLNNTMAFQSGTLHIDLYLLMVLCRYHRWKE